MYNVYYIKYKGPVVVELAQKDICSILINLNVETRADQPAKKSLYDRVHT